MGHKLKKGYVIAQWDKGEWAFCSYQPVYKTKPETEKRIKKLKLKNPSLKFKPLRVEYTEGLG